MNTINDSSSVFYMLYATSYMLGCHVFSKSVSGCCSVRYTAQPLYYVSTAGFDLDYLYRDLPDR